MPQAKEHTHHIRVKNSQLEMAAGRGGGGEDVEGKLREAQVQLEQLQSQREQADDHAAVVQNGVFGREPFVDAEEAVA